MISKYGINPVGLTRRQTYEELTHTKPFPLVYPDRSATFLRNSREMSQLLNMGMYELEEEQRRQMMERQKLDMLSAIAKSSDLTINQLRILNNRAQAPDDTASSVDIIDLNKVADDIAAKEQAKRIQSDASLRQAQSSLEASLKRQSEVDPVQRMGQASGSGDDPNKMSAADVPDSGLMSGIKAEALMKALEASRIEKISTSDLINAQASKLLHYIKAKTINE